jgi:hypothetical protein
MNLWDMLGLRDRAARTRTKVSGFLVFVGATLVGGVLLGWGGLLGGAIVGMVINAIWRWRT